MVASSNSFHSADESAGDTDTLQEALQHTVQEEFRSLSEALLQSIQSEVAEFLREHHSDGGRTGVLSRPGRWDAPLSRGMTAEDSLGKRASVLASRGGLGRMSVQVAAARGLDLHVPAMDARPTAADGNKKPIPTRSTPGATQQIEDILRPMKRALRTEDAEVEATTVGEPSNAFNRRRGLTDVAKGLDMRKLFAPVEEDAPLQTGSVPPVVHTSAARRPVKRDTVTSKFSVASDETMLSGPGLSLFDYAMSGFMDEQKTDSDTGKGKRISVASQHSLFSSVSAPSGWVTRTVVDPLVEDGMFPEDLPVGVLPTIQTGNGDPEDESMLPTPTGQYAHGSLYLLVSSGPFEYLAACIIVLNAVMVGIQADYTIHNFSEEVPIVFLVTEIILLVGFGLELLCRILARGMAFFTPRDPEQSWNLFDAAIFVVHFADIFLTILSQRIASQFSAQMPGNASLFRVSRLPRIVRVARLLRIPRLLRFFMELRIMVHSIASSCKSLVWAMLLFLCLTYILGVFITGLIADVASTQPQLLDRTTDLHLYYGDLPRSLMSLFQATTGGLDWDVMLRPLVRDIHPLMAIPFAMYIGFTVLAMMNVITGIFVDQALETAKSSKDMDLRSHMRILFLQTDKDGSGMLSWEEFASQLEDPDMVRCFKMLDIDISEAKGLFTLLDTDTSGEIDAEEFVMGCLRLKGNAKAIDLATLMYFNKRMATWWAQQIGALRGDLHDILCCVCMVDREENAEETDTSGGQTDGKDAKKGKRVSTEGSTGLPSRATSGNHVENRPLGVDSIAGFATWQGLKVEASLNAGTNSSALASFRNDAASSVKSSPSLRQESA